MGSKVLLKSLSASSGHPVDAIFSATRREAALLIEGGRAKERPKAMFLKMEKGPAQK